MHPEPSLMHLLAVVPQASTMLLPLASNWIVIGGFMAVVMALLAGDFALFHRNPKAIS